MQKLPYLNVGCGYQYDNRWTNLDFVSTGADVIAHNLLQGIPFENEKFEVVYHSHVLEHLQKNDGEKLIKECFRVLKKDGIIRVVIPDLEGIVRNYLQCLEIALQNPDDKIAQANYDWILIEMFDQTVRTKSGGEMVAFLQQQHFVNEAFVYGRVGSEAKKVREKYLEKQAKNKINEVANVENTASLFRFLNPLTYLRFIKRLMVKTPNDNETQRKIALADFREGGEIHQWMYDRYSLAKLLTNQGFTDVKIHEAKTSEIPNFNSFGLDLLNEQIRKPDSLFMEARKP